MTTETPGNNCLKCGYLYESATHMTEEARPNEGDISICLNCGAVAIFNKDLSLRCPTPDEQSVITMNSEVTQLQIARAHVVTEDLRKPRHDHCDAGKPSPTAIRLGTQIQKLVQ
jgi:hypothetical protein